MKDASSMEATLRTIHENKTDPVEISYLVSDLIATGEEVVGILTTMLGHSAPDIRSAAALALGYVPYFSGGHYDVSDASQLLVHSLDDECDWVVFHSAKSLLLLEMKTESESGIATFELSKRFAGCLSSNDPILRVMAARRLGFTRMTPEVAVPALLIALTDPIGSVRLEAAVSLSRLNLVGSDIHSKLLPLLESSDPLHRFAAALVFMEFDEVYRETLFQGWLEDFERLENEHLARAASCFWWLDQLDEQSFSSLVRVFQRSSDPETRLTVINVITSFSPTFTAALPFLVEALNNDHKEICLAVAMVLPLWGDEAVFAIPRVVGVLERLCDEPDSSNRRENDLRNNIIGWLFAFLGELGPAAVEARSRLDGIVSRTRGWIAITARDTIKKIEGRSLEFTFTYNCGGKTVPFTVAAETVSEARSEFRQFLECVGDESLVDVQRCEPKIGWSDVGRA